MPISGVRARAHPAARGVQPRPVRCGNLSSPYMAELAARAPTRRLDRSIVTRSGLAKPAGGSGRSDPADLDRDPGRYFDLAPDRGMGAAD